MEPKLPLNMMAEFPGQRFGQTDRHKFHGFLWPSLANHIKSCSPYTIPWGHHITLSAEIKWLSLGGVDKEHATCKILLQPFSVYLISCVQRKHNKLQRKLAPAVGHLEVSVK